MLDAGSSLVGDELSNKTEGKVMVEAMGMLGYQAMAVGGSDFALGREALLERAKEAGFAILSANLVDASSQEAVLPAYTVVETGGRKVAVIGLTGPADLVPGEPGSLRIIDPISALRQAVNYLNGRADAIVVLAHVDSDWDRRLAAEVPGVAAIIAGGQYLPDQRPWVAPQTGTVVVHPGAQGEHLGVLNLHVDHDGRAISATWKSIALTSDFPDDPSVTDLVNRWRAKTEE